jgi:hypothetical protein
MHVAMLVAAGALLFGSAVAFFFVKPPTGYRDGAAAQESGVAVPEAVTA